MGQYLTFLDTGPVFPNLEISAVMACGSCSLSKGNRRSDSAHVFCNTACALRVRRPTGLSSERPAAARGFPLRSIAGSGGTLGPKRESSEVTCSWCPTSWPEATFGVRSIAQSAQRRHVKRRNKTLPVSKYVWEHLAPSESTGLVLCLLEPIITTSQFRTTVNPCWLGTLSSAMLSTPEFPKLLRILGVGKIPL